MAKITSKKSGMIQVQGSRRTVTVTRYCVAWGDSFSGWVARCDDGANYSDPQNRDDAINSARGMADGLFGY
jgi:hypothetical protein